MRPLLYIQTLYLFAKQVRKMKRVSFLTIFLNLFLVIFPLSHLLAGDFDDMVLIPEGSFIMGNNMGGADEKPEHQVYLKAFFIDKFEVTNADYVAFLNAKGNRIEDGIPWVAMESEFSRIGRVEGRFVVDYGYEDHPVVMVTFNGALAYARWVKKRLPTEAEWEKAARGGLTNSPYPWGIGIDTTLANYARMRMGTTPVGIFPPNYYGIYDMAGNVSEMVSDLFNTNYYKKSPEKNPRGPDVGEFYIVRGGNWLSDDRALRVSDRGDKILPRTALPQTGFRCVKAPD